MISLLYFCSGFAALLYQVTWTRITFSHFGIITANFSVVIASFMLGLGLGSAAGDRIAKHLSSFVSAWIRVALCETAIFAAAALVPWIFGIADDAWLSAAAFGSRTYFLWTGLIIFLTLLPSCCLMGMTLPLMMRAIGDDPVRKQSSFGFLYLANTAGAIAGAFACAFVLIELFGIHATLRLGYGANLLAASLAMSLWWKNKKKRIGLTASPLPQPDIAATSSTDARVLYLIASTGFLVMGLETVWYRSFTSVLKSSVYAHGAILVVYLLATLVGTGCYRWHLKRRNFHPTAAIVMILIAVIAQQCLIGSLMAPLMYRLFLSVFFICLPMGYLFPGLVDLFAQGVPAATGRIYALNVGAAMAGIVLTTYLFIPWFGCLWSMSLLALPLLLTLFADDAKSTRRGWPSMAIVVFSVVAFILTPLISKGSLDEWPQEDPAMPMKRQSIHRDISATALAYMLGADQRLAVNGIPMTNATSLTKIMAHLPLLYVNHEPSHILIICFGMGTTFRSAMSWHISTVAVELSKSVIDCFPVFFPNAEQLEHSDQASIIIDDGRRFLKRTNEQFDVITIDPPPPLEASGSGLLYSTEFYAAAKKKLNQGGVLQQWIPAADPLTKEAIARALVQSFRYVKVFSAIEGEGVHFLASESPLTILPRESWPTRIPVSAQADMVEWIPEKDFRSFLQHVLDNEKPVASLLNPQSGLMVTDDRPINEFFLLRKLKQAPSECAKICYKLITSFSL